ncbi:MAG: tetratricopeptide repeat protein, partial [Treponema sp.]|nr:tetratricopeptide repeat protein [Treponema sp.]
MKKKTALFFAGFLLLLGNGLYAQSNQTGDASVLNRSAVAHYNNGDYERALADLEAALKLDPNDATIKENYEVVKESIEYEVTRQKELAIVLKNIGIANYNKGEYDKAITDFEAALKIDPNNAD